MIVKIYIKWDNSYFVLKFGDERLLFALNTHCDLENGVSRHLFNIKEKNEIII